MYLIGQLYFSLIINFPFYEVSLNRRQSGGVSLRPKQAQVSGVTVTLSDLFSLSINGLVWFIIFISLFLDRSLEY